jgi:hypothetical protein
VLVLLVGRRGGVDNGFCHEAGRAAKADSRYFDISTGGIVVMFSGAALVAAGGRPGGSGVKTP